MSVHPPVHTYSAVLSCRFIIAMKSHEDRARPLGLSQTFLNSSRFSPPLCAGHLDGQRAGWPGITLSAPVLRQVGDSGFYVLRPARDAQPSSPDCMTLQSAWRPFRREGDHPNGRHSALYLASPAVAKMIGSAHAAEPDADVLTAHVAPGDVLIFGTDGLFDSVELAGDRGGPYRELVYKRAVQEQCAPEALAKELCHLAQQRAADPNAPTPYRYVRLCRK